MREARLLLVVDGVCNTHVEMVKVSSPSNGTEKWGQCEVTHGRRFGLKAARLAKIRFIPETDPTAFGFLDPSLVISAAHLIPMFNEGCTTQLLTASPTAGRPPGETDDWAAFFVSMYIFQSA